MEKERALQPIMNAILVFESASRTGSFSAAARALGTSQPSISRHISNLEAHLGCKLFTRHNNQVALTEAGRLLYEAAHSSVASLNAAVSVCQANEALKILTIGCTHGFSHLWMMPRFSALKFLFNDLEIRVVTSEFNQVSDTSEVDFSVRFCHGNKPAKGIHLFDEEVVLVAAPSLLSEYGYRDASDDIAWLQQSPLIHLDDGEEDWISWRKWFADHGSPYAPAAGTFFYRNYAFSLQAAAEGKGVALAWRHLLGGYKENGWLEVLDFPPLKTRGSYRLFCAPEWYERKIGTKVIKWFELETGSPDQTPGQTPKP